MCSVVPKKKIKKKESCTGANAAKTSGCTPESPNSTKNKLTEVAHDEHATRHGARLLQYVPVDMIVVGLINACAVITESEDRPNQARCEGLQISVLGGGGQQLALSLVPLFSTTASISTSKPHHTSEVCSKPGAYLLSRFPR